MELFNIRPYSDSDFNIVIDSWTKSFRGSDFSKNMRSGMYKDYMISHIKSLLERSEVAVACDPDDPNYIFGWACGNQIGRSKIPQLHYVWIKEAFREHGIARALLHSFGIEPYGSTAFIYTHRSPMARILEKESQTAQYGVFNPFMAFVEEL